MAEDRNMAREDKMAEESGRTAKNSAQENNPVKKKGTRPEESGSAAEGKAPAKKKKIIIVTGNPRGGKQGGQRGAYSSGSGSYSSGGGKSRERGSGSGGGRNDGNRRPRDVRRRSCGLRPPGRDVHSVRKRGVRRLPGRPGDGIPDRVWRLCCSCRPGHG